MKALPIALLLLLATSSLQAQSKSDRAKADLMGPVRSMRTEIERTGTDGSMVARVPVAVEVFDERGNIIRHEAFNLDGSLKSKVGWGHVYDAQGREVKTYYYDAKGALTNTGVSVYDEKGHRIETTQINPNGSINHIRAYSYDEKGNNIRETHRNENGSARNLINRKYDADGRVTEEVFLGADGALDHRNVLTYDAHGHQMGWTLFKSDGTVVQGVRRSLSYDERGNLKESVNYLSDNSIGSRELFSYEFDEHGNWIKRNTAREVFKEGRSSIESEVSYRTITYF